MGSLDSSCIFWVCKLMKRLPVRFNQIDAFWSHDCIFLTTEEQCEWYVHLERVFQELKGLESIFLLTSGSTDLKTSWWRGSAIAPLSWYSRLLLHRLWRNTKEHEYSFQRKKHPTSCPSSSLSCTLTTTCTSWKHCSGVFRASQLRWLKSNNIKVHNTMQSTSRSIPRGEWFIFVSFDVFSRCSSI